MSNAEGRHRGQPPRVLIADDHPLYCDALRAVVPHACPDAEISEAASQEEVLGGDRRRSLRPGAARPQSAGRHRPVLSPRPEAVAPATPIVVVSAVGDPKIMQDAIMAGASAFIPKSAPSQVLINALKVILAGGTYMPTGMLAALRNADAAPAMANSRCGSAACSNCCRPACRTNASRASSRSAKSR